MNKEARHTPGPWTTGKQHPCRVLTVNGHGPVVAFACDPVDEGTEYDWQIANARLIAAAPELLAICRWLYEIAEDRPEDIFDEEGEPTEEWNRLIRSTRAAIAKTRRGSNEPAEAKGEV